MNSNYRDMTDIDNKHTFDLILNSIKFEYFNLKGGLF